LDLQPLSGWDNDILTVCVPIDAQPAENHPDHIQVADPCLADNAGPGKRLKEYLGVSEPISEIDLDFFKKSG
jgi:hypothetical protein